MFLTYKLMQNQRIAVLDLGTNTFNLLIAEPKPPGFDLLYSEKKSVKIGKNGISKGIIDEEAQVRLFEALRAYQQIIQRFRIANERVFALATSAFRSAKNAAKIIQEIHQKIGIAVKVISGEEEAEYIYKGVRAALDLGEKNSLIMDIGGGSVEFIICNQNKLYWKKSFEIGGQRLADMFMKKDPIPDLEVQKMDIYLESQLFELSNAVFTFNPKILIGAAGAFETVVEVIYRKNQPDQLDGFLDEDKKLRGQEFGVSLDDYHYFYQEIIRSDREQRLKIPGMPEMRADMIVVACCLLKFVLERYEIEKLKVTTFSLKEGFLVHKLGMD